MVNLHFRLILSHMIFVRGVLNLRIIITLAIFGVIWSFVVGLNLQELAQILEFVLHVTHNVWWQGLLS